MELCRSTSFTESSSGIQPRITATVTPSATVADPTSSKPSPSLRMAKRLKYSQEVGNSTSPTVTQNRDGSLSETSILDRVFVHTSLFSQEDIMSRPSPENCSPITKENAIDPVSSQPDQHPPKTSGEWRYLKLTEEQKKQIRDIGDSDDEYLDEDEKINWSTVDLDKVVSFRNMNVATFGKMIDEAFPKQ